MFWADEVAGKIKERNLPLEWVDDMKTPSGRVHVGSLLGVIFHDLVYKALLEQKTKAKFTYVFENHDPMDDIPSYLPYEQYEPYLGMPLFKIPSPVPGFTDFAEYYALEFKKAFNELGANPQILWTKDLYQSGKMNEAVREALNNASEIREIYAEMYHKTLPTDWYPFQVYCESCGKVSTTKVYKWDQEKVYYTCQVEGLKWVKGCSYTGSTSPFSDQSAIRGKMPWKVEWPAKWKAIGVTVEGAGKDHMSAGGSHDIAIQFCERIFNYPVPYPIPYEFMLIGGKKMSSSKGRGFAAADLTQILPPSLARFLIVKMNISQQTNFDPTDPTVIPHLFDEYQRYAKAYLAENDSDMGRIFKLSQVSQEIVFPPTLKFSTLAQWVQMPNMQQTIVADGLEEWAKYAKVWVEKYALESERFSVQTAVPEAAKALSQLERNFLLEVAHLCQTTSEPEQLQSIIFTKAKEMDIGSKDAFAAIYTVLLGKKHGPKAGALLCSLEPEFIAKRLSLSA